MVLGILISGQNKKHQIHSYIQLPFTIQIPITYILQLSYFLQPIIVPSASGDSPCAAPCSTLSASRQRTSTDFACASTRHLYAVHKTSSRTNSHRCRTLLRRWTNAISASQSITVTVAVTQWYSKRICQRICTNLASSESYGEGFLDLLFEFIGGEEGLEALDVGGLQIVRGIPLEGRFLQLPHRTLVVILIEYPDLSCFPLFDPVLEHSSVIKYYRTV